MSTIGLCMIVKNEAKVILKCLASALPLVDYVLIVDTGSSDGTQELIRGFLADRNVPGAVIDEPWRNFAYNRTFALDRLREVETVDYAMIIDADDVVVLDPNFDPVAFKSQMQHDLYDVEVTHGGTSFYRPHICRNRLAFSFKGVLHEYLEPPPGPITRQTARGFSISTGSGGARSQNPRKYQDDAAVLENVLATETDPFLISRYTFYLAQSYKDCGEREKALGNYLKRAELGFWIEEVYLSLLEAGNLMAALDRPFEEVIALYERATKTVPARGEALHAASRYCRNRGRYAEGQEYARRGLSLTEPVGLFVQPWVYDYGLLDEFSVNAYWTGAYRESLDACLKLLANDKMPVELSQRVKANARFAADKLPDDMKSVPIPGEVDHLFPENMRPLEGGKREPSEQIYDRRFYEVIAPGSSRSAREVVPHLLQLFPDCRSVVDFGCGDGSWLAEFNAAGVDRVRGVDSGVGVDPDRPIQDGWFLAQDLRDRISIGRFDLCISLEVAEHLPATNERTFVQNLCSASDAVVFSAAVPRQGGDNHVNEQWLEHWVSLFAESGYRCFDVLRPKFWANTRIEWWYRQNIVVFANDFARTRYPHLEALPTFGGVSLIHPEAFIWRVGA